MLLLVVEGCIQLLISLWCWPDVRVELASRGEIGGGQAYVTRHEDNQASLRSAWPWGCSTCEPVLWETCFWDHLDVTDKFEAHCFLHRLDRVMVGSPSSHISQLSDCYMTDVPLYPVNNDINTFWAHKQTQVVSSRTRVVWWWKQRLITFKKRTCEADIKYSIITKQPMQCLKFGLRLRLGLTQAHQSLGRVSWECSQ